MGMDEDQTQLDKFIEAVKGTVERVTGEWTSTDYFAKGYTEALLFECNMILDVLSKPPAAGDEPEVRFARLLDHWIEHFSAAAYRSLAKSISTGYSSMMGLVDDQIRAEAQFTIFQELVTFKKYGLFDPRSERYRVGG